jgi:D-alanyl-D-alanine carboxypeptidase
MAMYQRMRSDMQTIALASVLKTSADEIDVVVSTHAKEYFEFDFLFDGAPDAFISGIRVHSVDHPNGSTGPPAAAPIAAAPISDADFATKLASFLDSRSHDDTFSGVVLVARGDQTLFAKAYGLASKEYATPNVQETRFNLGSINKLMTHIAIEQLIEQHRLSSSDVIGRWLPDYPNRDAAAKVTVQELIDMTSGIGDFFGPQFERAPKDSIRTLRDYLPFFAAKPLAFAPGTSHQYSNGGYVVLGLIIERASGENYYDYVQHHIFERASMAASGWFERDAPVSNVATGYTRSSATAQWRNNIYEQPARGSSAGGGYSNAGDMLKFAAALEQGSLLSSSDTQQLLAGGLGVAGGSPGCNAALEIDPQRKYVVIVLSNYDPPAAESVARQIRAWLNL